MQETNDSSDTGCWMALLSHTFLDHVVLFPCGACDLQMVVADSINGKSTKMFIIPLFCIFPSLLVVCFTTAKFSGQHLPQMTDCWHRSLAYRNLFQRNGLLKHHSHRDKRNIHFSWKLIWIYLKRENVLLDSVKDFWGRCY